jgi:hypothetical protein
VRSKRRTNEREHTAWASGSWRSWPNAPPLGTSVVSPTGNSEKGRTKARTQASVLFGLQFCHKWSAEIFLYYRPSHNAPLGKPDFNLAFLKKYNTNIDIYTYTIIYSCEYIYWIGLILRFTKSVNSLLIETSSPTKKIISHKYNVHVKSMI